MTKLEKLKEHNPTVYRVLKNSFLQNKISHAYIFSSHQNIEIKIAPQFLIEILISDGNIFANAKPRSLNTYPDLHIINGENNIITKEAIINALNYLNLKPFEQKGVKILLIYNIENANKQAANALLKFLETPKLNTYIIMTSNFIKKVPSTIKSRAIEIKVRSYSKNYLIKEISDLGYGINIAQVIAFFTQDKNQAFKILKQNNFIKIYKNIIKIFSETLNNYFNFIINFSQIIDESNYSWVLGIVLTFVNDILNYQQNLPLINFEHVELIEKYSHINFDYFNAIKAINHFLINQQYNVNFNLAKNWLLLQLEKCYE